MNRLFAIIFAVMLAAVSCQHEEIWDKLNDHEQRIKQLEKLFPIYAQMIDVQAQMDEIKKKGSKDTQSGYGLFGALGL